MKKLIALILALMMVLSMAACGSEETYEVSTTSGTNATEASDAATETTEATEAPIEASVTTISETVVYDADGVKITATGLEDDGMGGKRVKFLVENNTEKNIAYSGTYYVVNDVTLNGWMYIDVAAGKKANGALELYSEELEHAAITDIATVVGHDATIVDTDSYETIAEAPFSLESSANGVYAQTIVDSGEVLFQQEGITVICQNYTESDYNQTLHMLIKNDTERDFNANAQNVSVNGFTIDAWMYDTVYAGTVRYCTLEFYSEDLVENGIENVEDVTFSINFIDPETYDNITSTEELQVFVNQ